MVQERKKHPMVAVAGTYGKSMSGFLLQHILQKPGYPGEGGFIESLSARKILSRALSCKAAGWLGLEVSPQDLNKGLYRNLPFDLGILTNLYPPARDQVPWARYVTLHRNFFAAVPQRGVSVINADNPQALEIMDVAGGKPVTYALNYSRAMVTAKNYKPLPMGSSFEAVVRGELPRLGSWHGDISSFPLRLMLPGEIGVYTALAAVTAALVLGVREEVISQRVKTFSGIKRRLELFPAGDIFLLDDTAPCSLALKFVFNSLTPLRFQRVFLVLGMEKGTTDKLAKIALELRAQEDKHPLAEIFLTSCSEYLPPAMKASQAEEKAFLNAWHEAGGRASVAVFDSLVSALQELSLSLKDGDLVLLLGGRGMNDARRLMSLHIREEGGSPAFPGQAESTAEYLGLLNPS